MWPKARYAIWLLPAIGGHILCGAVPKGRDKFPLGTTRVNVGAIVNGRGDARFDDFALQLSPIAGRTPDAYAKAYVNAACDTIKHHQVGFDWPGKVRRDGQGFYLAARQQ